MEVSVLGVLEFNSIAAGIEAMDFMVKEAPISIVDAKTICPGKFLILVSGDVASVDASLTAGKRAGAGYLIDELFLPNLHEYIIPAIVGAVECDIWDAVGVVESF
jgi:microcompartment protein CcmL/EutN